MMDKLHKQLNVAIIMATRAHRTQVDKCGMPYILHPLAVMNSVDSIEQKIVAVLHDVIEDTSLDCGQLIAGGISANLATLVSALTHLETETNRQYMDKVKLYPCAVVVKLADIEHNTSFERMEGLKEEERSYLWKKYNRCKRYLNGGEW